MTNNKDRERQDRLYSALMGAFKANRPTLARCIKASIDGRRLSADDIIDSWDR